MEPVHQGESLIEEGVVLAVTPAGDGRSARALVRLAAGDHCEGCPASVVCRPASDDRRLLEVVDSIGVAVGDQVRVAVPGGAVLKASFLVYGLPLLLLLAGVWLGTRIWPATEPMRDLWAFLVGVALAGAAIPLVRSLLHQAEARGEQALAARIVDRTSALQAKNE
jgi:sigma-E factor negative regulatory protein RseC